MLRILCLTACSFLWLFAGSFQTGDIVFRQASGLFSTIARNFSPTDKRFSHVGIILVKKSTPYVVHTLQETNGTTIEPFERFIKDAKLYGVYRLKDIDQNRMHTALNEAVAKALPFDDGFDLTTKTHLYCTELVANILHEHFDNRLDIPHTYYLNRAFISIEDILNIKGLTPFVP